jgi:hypothetical protein
MAEAWGIGSLAVLQLFTAAMLAVVAVIHLLPLPGVLGAGRLGALYGLSELDSNLAILMRHRAVLFGLLGAFLVLSIFRHELRTLAFISGFVSVLSFLLLAWSAGGYNMQIGRVVVADIVALVCLVLGIAAHVVDRI